MKKLLSVLFVLSLFATACQTTEEVTTVEVEEEVEEIESSVSHYSGRYLSFDYPNDIELLVEPFGEGAIGEKISFIEWDETIQSYGLVGPGVYISNEGGSAADEFEKNKEENSEELSLEGSEAYITYNGEVMCEPYTSAHLLFPYDFDEKSEFYGDEMHAKFTQVWVCPGDRYNEILNMFLETVSF